MSLLDNSEAQSIYDHHPLLRYLADSWRMGARVHGGTDLELGTWASCYMVIAPEPEENVLAFGIPEADVAAFTSVPWDLAVLLLNYNNENRDLLAFRCTDVGGENPVKWRVFFSISIGVSGFIQEYRPSLLRIRAARRTKIAKGRPKMEMPFSIRSMG